jgi:hypothetical protein
VGSTKRVKWPPVYDRAREIVEGYAAQGTRVTLRQIFYRLVAELWIPNLLNTYTYLGRSLARLRREDDFPRLLDQGRRIERPLYFEGVDDAKDWLKDQYRRDRTEGQPWSIYIGAEKATLLPQLDNWFSDRGLPVFSLRCYSGQELVTDVQNDIMVSDRPAVLIYAGDFDPSGVHINRDFAKRVGIFDKIERIALNGDQIVGLPSQPGKSKDPRARGFVREHGELVQVELEALDPNDLKQFYEDAIAQYWDEAAYRHVLRKEKRERDSL